MEVAAFTHGLPVVTNLNQGTTSRFWEFARYLVHVDEIANDSSHFCGRDHIFLNLKMHPRMFIYFLAITTYKKL